MARYLHDHPHGEAISVLERDARERAHLAKRYRDYRPEMYEAISAEAERLFASAKVLEALREDTTT